MAIQIQDLHPIIELHANKSGLKVGPFVDSLAINPTKMITKIREKVVGYVNMEEIREAK